jgi:transposase
MKLENIDINETIQTVKQMLEKEKGLNPGLKSSLELLLLIISLLVNRLGLNSNNSSKPPSSDPNRKKIKKSGKRKQGG